MKRFLTFLIAIALILGLSVIALGDEYEDMLLVFEHPTHSEVFGYIGEMTQINDAYEEEILDRDGNIMTFYEVEILDSEDNVIVVLVTTINTIIIDTAAIADATSIIDGTAHWPTLEDHGGNIVHVIYNPLTNHAHFFSLNVVRTSPYSGNEYIILGFGHVRPAVFGYVGEITQTNDIYEVEILDIDSKEVIAVVLVSATSTAVVNSETGLPTNLEDHGDNLIHVTYNPLTGNAHVFVINAELGIPGLYTIEDIWHGSYGASITVNNGHLWVSVREYADIHAWSTGQIITLDDFQVGDVVLLWFPFVLYSFPGQAFATRAVRIAPAQSEANQYPAEAIEEYTKETLQLIGGTTHAGITLYPVRDNAATAGYTIVWNARYRRAELILGDTLITLSPGYTVFYVNGVQYTLPAPSLLENGRLLAPASFFDSL